MDDLLEMARAGNVRVAARELDRRIPPARQPVWAASLLAAFRDRFPPFPEVQAVYETALERTRWHEAHHAFSGVRALTLAAEENEDTSNYDFLQLAELVAKVTYNASGEDAPFKPSCGLELIALVRTMAEALEDPGVRADVDRLVAGQDAQQDNLVPPPIDYLHPQLPAGLRRVTMAVVEATPASLEGYGRLVDDPEHCRVEIVRWPARGSRPVDADTGDQGGTTEGVFVSEWQGDVLYGRNEAVGGHYILAYAQPPELARTDHAELPRRMMLWHANYHPDGGQLFFPLDHRPFYVPLALPGDDIAPERFVCFRFDGHQGLYIHPDIWHEGVFGLAGTQRFFDKQGAVHARVSVDFAREFGCLLEAPIP